MRMSIAGVCLGLVFYATTALLIWMFPDVTEPVVPLPQKPVPLLEPFRIANRYGLFAVMTHARYEIEFQGSQDGNRMDALSVPLQAAGRHPGAGNVRALPAAI